jgi:hypothetical protein
MNEEMIGYCGYSCHSHIILNGTRFGILDFVIQRLAR